jgi:hypothetical protein
MSSSITAGTRWLAPTAASALVFAGLLSPEVALADVANVGPVVSSPVTWAVCGGAALVVLAVGVMAIVALWKIARERSDRPGGGDAS